MGTRQYQLTMLLYQGAFTPWLAPHTRTKLLELHDRILATDNLLDLWHDVLVLSFLVYFSSKSYPSTVGDRSEETAHTLLQSFFELCPAERRLSDDSLVWSINSQPVEGAYALQVMVSRFTSPTDRLPQRERSLDVLEDDPRFDITKPEFFTLDNWTNTDWIVSGTEYGKREQFVPIDGVFDVHLWRESEDPWIHAICARLLCRVPDGKVPTDTAVNETFEVVDKLFLTLPKRRNPQDESEEWPHSHIFPVKIYFILAVRIGTLEQAQTILELAMTKFEFSLHELLEFPGTYDVYHHPDIKASKYPRLISNEDMDFVRTTLSDTLKQRKQKGQEQPLDGVEWPELLRRLSEAAFKVYDEEYAESDEHPQRPADILFPPISVARIDEIEAKLGPLPQDLKAMALIANGFTGAWHFAGGGFPGLQHLRLEDPSEYEHYLSTEPIHEVIQETITMLDGVTRTVTKHIVNVYGDGRSSGTDWGPVYAAYGTVENDGYNHLICPPETWKKIQEAQGRTVKDG